MHQSRNSRVLQISVICEMYVLFNRLSHKIYLLLHGTTVDIVVQDALLSGFLYAQKSLLKLYVARSVVK